MHKKTSSLKSIVIILIVVAVVLIAYFYYQGSASSASSSLLTSSGPTADSIGQQVLGLLSQIQSLRIDTSLFTDPGFQTLRDYSVQIPPENVGRSNPFAPLPGAPASSTGAAASH